MTDSIFIAFVRHGPTDWNADKRIQGRTDIELSIKGHATVSAWELPQRARNWSRFTSPLTRTRQTAEALDSNCVWQTESSLIETNWGEYEGLRIADLRQSIGTPFTQNESRGLDFCPPGGESPRDVQRRLRSWLTKLVQADRSVVAVTHKGVIRAALALATDWDMVGKPPAKLQWSHAHIFRLTRGATLDTESGYKFQISAFEIDEVNIDLTRHDSRADTEIS